MFVLGKKTIDSVNRFISGTRGTSTAFSSGAWEIFSKSFGAAWALLSVPSAAQILTPWVLPCHGWRRG